MVEEHTHEGEALSLIGGNLCLDFTNTVNWRGVLDREEALTSYAALVAWGRRAGILTGDGAARLLSEAARRPADATAALERAIALRETIRRVVLAASEGRPPEAGDLDTLNGALAAALREARLVPAADGFAWGWRDDPAALDRVLWPVLRAAADLLTSGDLDRVRECAGDDCGWLFLDMSRNRSRRWCDMQSCGNRAKARRYYARKRHEGDG